MHVYHELHLYANAGDMREYAAESVDFNNVQQKHDCVCIQEVTTRE